ncbi:Belongs to the glycosyltransferase 29 [Dionaea muscipula]
MPPPSHAFTQPHLCLASCHRRPSNHICDSPATPTSVVEPSHGDQFLRLWPGLRKSLDDWARKKGTSFQSETMSELVDLVKAPIDMHKGKGVVAGFKEPEEVPVLFLCSCWQQRHPSEQRPRGADR